MRFLSLKITKGRRGIGNESSNLCLINIVYTAVVLTLIVRSWCDSPDNYQWQIRPVKNESEAQYCAPSQLCRGWQAAKETLPRKTWRSGDEGTANKRGTSYVKGHNQNSKQQGVQQGPSVYGCLARDQR